jgi:hypothetical protein
VIIAAKPDGLSNDVLIGTKLLPQRMTQNRNAFGTDVVLAGMERPS